MSQGPLTIRIHVPLWVRLYVRLLYIVEWTTGLAPPTRRVAQFVARHTKVKS